MNASSRSKCVRRTALLLSLGIVLALPGSAFAQRICRSEAHEWAAANRGNLPQTYEELSVMPLAYRRAAYAALPAAAKSRIWRTQLERVLEMETELTPAQKALLLEAVQLATPDTFAATRDRSSLKYRQMRSRVESLETRAKEAFGADRAARIFARIGPADTDTLYFIDRQKAEAIVPGLQMVEELTSGQQQPAPDTGCSCSDASDYCSSGFNCTGGGCIRISDECGTFWTYDCDGSCKVNAAT
ncbi:MAG TPA: bacteriocin fulvocin C-related protein [Thermoanaerobaculia bacterium]